MERLTEAQHRVEALLGKFRRLAAIGCSDGEVTR